MPKTNKKSFIGLVARGLGMGAADVVPGVSGGTIAFITGIYEELIDTIRTIDHNTFLSIIKEGPQAFWEKINGPFLLPIFQGMGG